jgi:hypothetical protein
MSTELSPPAADKELDCSGRMRPMPAARIRPISPMRSSADILPGGIGFGPDRASCMRPFATEADWRNGNHKLEIDKPNQFIVEYLRNH